MDGGRLIRQTEMIVWVSNTNAPETCEIEWGCGRVAVGKLLRTGNTRNRSPQNIYNLLYDIHNVSIGKPILFSEQMTIFENIIFLWGCGDLRGSI
jgi:hypothetical protein